MFKLLQPWQEEINKSGFLGTIAMDLSKSYNCPPHDLLVARFESYNIGKNGLNLIHKYLKKFKQRTNKSSSYTDWCDIVSGIPQDSIFL